MTDFEWNPDTYLQTMQDEIPGYDELQNAVAAASTGRNVLELGTGTGETALRVLARNPGAHWTGIDSSEAMLTQARQRLPIADLRVGRLEDPLPEGPFDLAVSCLAVHHLNDTAKRDLFVRVAAVAESFVLGDLVVPQRPEDAVVFVDWEMDLPSSVSDQLAWLGEAGFDPEATYVRPDLAVFTARRRWGTDR